MRLKRLDVFPSTGTIAAMNHIEAIVDGVPTTVFYAKG
jgi:hypothetical protein